jgi:hypothetical protein
MTSAPGITQNERLAVIETKLQAILDKIEPLEAISTEIAVIKSTYCKETEDLKKKIGGNGNQGIEKDIIAIKARLNIIYAGLGVAGVAAITSTVKIIFDWITGTK